MRWLKKREVAMIYLLDHKFGDRAFTFFEALSVLEPVFGRKVARNRIKYFIKVGVIQRINGDKYRVKPLIEVIEEIVLPYIVKRSQRLRRRTQL